VASARSPQQLDIALSVSDRSLEHLSDEILRLLLVENAGQLEEGSGVMVDEDDVFVEL